MRPEVPSVGHLRSYRLLTWDLVHSRKRIKLAKPSVTSSSWPRSFMAQFTAMDTATPSMTMGARPEGAGHQLFPSPFCYTEEWEPGAWSCLRYLSQAPNLSARELDSRHPRPMQGLKQRSTGGLSL